MGNKRSVREEGEGAQRVGGKGDMRCKKSWQKTYLFGEIRCRMTRKTVV